MEAFCFLAKCYPNFLVLLGFLFFISSLLLTINVNLNFRKHPSTTFLPTTQIPHLTPTFNITHPTFLLTFTFPFPFLTLEPGNYYHIYNRGVNRCNLFYTNENYNHFLRLYEKYIDPIAETYAWVLLKNHFHLLVRIRQESEIILRRLPVPVKVQTPDAKPRLKKTHLYFSDLFNAYSQAINKQENRTGSLFQRPFRRIPVDDQEYFRRLIVYIHTNPVHHGFTDDYRCYPWSSYGTILSVKPTRLQQETVIGWFSGEGEFILKHTQELKMDLFDRYIIE